MQTHSPSGTLRERKGKCGELEHHDGVPRFQSLLSPIIVQTFKSPFVLLTPLVWTQNVITVALPRFRDSKNVHVARSGSFETVMMKQVTMMNSVSPLS